MSSTAYLEGKDFAFSGELLKEEEFPYPLHSKECDDWIEGYLDGCDEYPLGEEYCKELENYHAV